MPKTILNEIKFGRERLVMLDAIVRVIETYRAHHGPQLHTWELFVQLLIMRQMFSLHAHGQYASGAGIAKAIGMPNTTAHRRLNDLMRIGAVERRGSRYVLRPEFFNTPTALNGFKRRLAQFRKAQKLAWISAPDGTTEYHAPYYLAYFDLSSTALDVHGHDCWTTIVHPEDLPALMKKWETARSTGTLYEARARMRCHDGEYRWFLNRATPEHGKNGKIVRWKGTTAPE